MMMRQGYEKRSYRPFICDSPALKQLMLLFLLTVQCASAQHQNARLS
jgi:hypothetical protein